MLTQIDLSNHKIFSQKKTRSRRGRPKTFAEFLAREIAFQFNDVKSLRFYKKCFSQDLARAQYAVLRVQSFIEVGKARNPGALFTHLFKNAPGLSIKPEN